MLQNNPLYGAAALQSASCGGVSSVALDGLGNLRTYYTSVLTCLDAAWLQVAAAGIDVRPAGLEVFTGPSSGSCLVAAEYSFYCASSGTIFMHADGIIQPCLDLPTDDYSHGITRLTATHTIAHEYGHHLQRLTGILDASGAEIFGTETERRVELQASCLANVFLASPSTAYPIASEYRAVQNLWRFITRVPNHSSEVNQALWTERGYQAASPGACNTFSATPEEVS